MTGVSHRTGARLSTDAEEFKTLVRDTHRDVTAYVRRRVPGIAADDLVSDAFAAAWEHWQTRRPTDPRPWLYGIARNMIRNHRRTSIRRSQRTVLLAAPASAEVAQLVGDQIDLARAFDSMRERDREVLRLAAWEGLGPAEIATVLDCSPEAAATRLHRARTRLADALSEDS